MAASKPKRESVSNPDFGSHINGPLYTYIKELRDTSPCRQALKAIAKKSNREGYIKQTDLFMYWDLDDIAKICNRSVLQLLRLGSRSDPKYLADQSFCPNPALADRFYAVRDFYNFLYRAAPQQKERVWKIINIFLYEREWMQESSKAHSPVWRLKLFYSNMIRLTFSVDRYKELEESEKVDALPSIPEVEQFVNLVPSIGNSSIDLGIICRYYHLSYHWMYAQKPTTSVYDFPDNNDELLFDYFTLLKSNEQKIITNGLLKWF